MPILNWEVSSSSVFASFFILMTHNSLVNFKLKYFQLWTKNPIKIPILRLIGPLVKIYEILYLFSKPKVSFFQILHYSLMLRKITLLDFFRSNITRKYQSKCKFFGLLSARIKIQQILIIFETTNQFSFILFINLKCHQT